MKKKLIIGFEKFFIIFFFACTPNPDNDRFEHFLANLSQGPAPDTATPPSGNPNKPAPIQLPESSGSTQNGPTTTTGGIPRNISAGFCGDGIMNGDLEQCDKGSIPKTSCTGYGGVAGVVSCDKECLLDISNCITPAVDEIFGGTAENCRCNCDGDRCSGGCTPNTDSAGSSASCLFDCNNDCVCNCEERLENHLERCRIRCECGLDTAGFPDCSCTINDCITTVSIKQNIAATAIRILGKK